MLSKRDARRAKPVEVPPNLPDPALPYADWADAFEITSHDDALSMTQIAERTVGSSPLWVRQLMWIRNLIVAPFGLKSGNANKLSAGIKTVGIFPILSEAPNRLVLGLDDKHLNFRLVISREHDGSHQRIRATTLVQRHSLFGKVYIALITPFHRAIVASSLKSLGHS